MSIRIIINYPTLKCNCLFKKKNEIYILCFRCIFCKPIHIFNPSLLSGIKYNLNEINISSNFYFLQTTLHIHRIHKIVMHMIFSFLKFCSKKSIVYYTNM